VSPPTFFSADLSATETNVRVTGAEARHAISVQRIAIGEVVDIVNGRGLRVRTEVSEIDGSDVMTCAVREVWDEPEPRPYVTVVQALIKDGEQAVDLLTQAGVDRIVPWAAQRSIVHWRGERAAKAQAKWTNAAHQAAKQSRRARWPEVTDLASTNEVNALLAGADLALVCDEQGAEAITNAPLPTEGTVVIVIGPEGGVAPGELTGGRPVRLGPGVWRSSAAGMAAIVALFAGSDRWAVGESRDE
jgi:16S rRNA (uracil1498-N3)-methyltransferase